MGEHRRWLGTVRRMFIRSTCRRTAAIDAKDSTEIVSLKEETVVTEAVKENKGSQNKRKSIIRRGLSLEDLAAIKIQSCFRGHLARRAFRALKSLVKLQAIVRGVCVRRQARIAVRCMQAMVKLQVKVHTRQMTERTEKMNTLHAVQY